jgi:hypothetical protein
MTKKWIPAFLLGITMVVPFCILLRAQQPNKPSSAAKTTPRAITNLDVIKMVQAGLSESIVINTIQSRKSKFDVSPDGLIALHKGGVTQGEMDSIMAVANGTAPAASQPSSSTYAAAPPTPAAAPATPALASTKSRLPVVTVVQNGSTQEIALEKTQLAQTKTKPSSMKSLASDSVLTQAMTSEVSSAAAMAATHAGSPIGGTSVQQGAAIFSGLMAHRKPMVTYVWGVQNPASTNVLQTATPTFNIDFSNAPGVNPDEFEPAVVRLTPAQNTCRLVGATQGKDDASTTPAADWQLYSSFMEERVTVNSRKVAKGQYQLSPSLALLPGEYALVLRPVSKSKKFSGGEVARAQGDGLMFDAAWSFQISNDAQ